MGGVYVPSGKGAVHIALLLAHAAASSAFTPEYRKAASSHMADFKWAGGGGGGQLWAQKGARNGQRRAGRAGTPEHLLMAVRGVRGGNFAV